MSDHIGSSYVRQSGLSVPVMGRCYFFGGHATALKAAPHQAMTKPAVVGIKRPPPIPMPPAPDLIPIPHDSYTPTK